MSRTPARLGSVVAAAVLAAAGCQPYRPAPLNLDGHRAAWEARDLAAPGVAAYAEQLSAARGEPTAQPFDPADGLSLREAEVVALYFNPQLRAARLRARVSAVGVAEAGRWEDPVLRVDVERILDSVDEPWVIGGLLDITVPLSGRLALEKDRAISEADAAGLNVLLDEQRVLAELSNAWSELAVLDRRVEVARSALADVDAVVGQADRLRAAGEIGPLEAGLFRVERVRRRAELQSLEPRRRERELAVKALLGLTPSSPVRLIPSLPAPVDASGSAERRMAVEQGHPRLRLVRAEYAVAERTLELEVRRQFPDLTLGGGYGRDEGTDRVLGGLSVPIPVLNANRRAIAKARANRDAARASAEAAYEDLVSSLARAEASLEAARVEREVLEKELAPLVDEQLRAARDLGRIGDVSTIVLFEAITRGYETRVEILDAVGREAAARNAIDALLRPTRGAAPHGKEER